MASIVAVVGVIGMCLCDYEKVQRCGKSVEECLSGVDVSCGFGCELHMGSLGLVIAGVR